MNEKLRAHVEGLFCDAPKTMQVVEIKEEILQNTIDRYNDLIAEGKSEEAAFNISVAGIGDVNSLISSIVVPKAASGYTNAEIEKNRRTRSMLLSIAVALYILSVVPPIICDELFHSDFLGATLMFVFIAAATAIIIYRSGLKLTYDKKDNTVVENFKEWNQSKKEDRALKNAISGAVWAFTISLYFVISFTTKAWYITWITFLIGIAADNIIRAVFDLKK